MLSAMPFAPASGLVVLCDDQGVVIQVLYNTVGAVEAGLLGQPLTGLIERGSRERALDFLVETRARGVALGWELSFTLPAGVVVLQLAGVWQNGRLLVAAARQRQDVLKLYEVLTEIHSELASALRAALKERTDQARIQAERDHRLYDEISRLNNELVNLQRELAQQNAGLERQVAARTAELSQSNAELRQALRAKDEFLSAMSHELRTPLNGILSFAELMEDQVYGPLNLKQRQAVDQIKDSGLRLLDLVTDVLDFTQMDTGQVVLQFRAVPADELCETALLKVKEAAAQRGVDLRYEPPPAGAAVRADPHYLQRALGHLLCNAVQFTPAGGQVRFSARLEAAEGVVRLAVSDDGPGISAADLKRLFLPFTQLDASLARPHEGAGLGLAITRQIVEAHHGRLRLESAPGQGATFEMTLPAASEA